MTAHEIRKLWQPVKAVPPSFAPRVVGEPLVVVLSEIAAQLAELNATMKRIEDTNEPEKLGELARAASSSAFY